ncbi:MAG TPA: polyprenyl synthetase family protein [Acidimicrobiales bacterium]|nr:polyprenyl synthetase family protein [Acidimicrobiales bacterium]
MALPSPLLALDGMAGELTRVEDALRSSVVADDAYLTEIASHLIRAGGKRLRPAFSVAVGAVRTGLPVPDGVVLGGVAVELVQVGSLHHDDVMDEALTRRGVESVNARWGNLRAILSGDFLLAKASEIAASLGVEVAELLAKTIGALCEGQVRELQTTFNAERTEEQYLSAIAGKTASLFAAATRIGAIVADLPRDQVEALTLYGHRYGMAFQIVDDILDVVATDEQLGKPSGQDLAEGIYNLPVIRALRRGDAVAGELRGLLGSPLGRDDVDHARKLVRADGAIEDSLVLAAAYCREAVEALAPVTGRREAIDALATAAAGLVDTVPAL